MNKLSVLIQQVEEQIERTKLTGKPVRLYDPLSYIIGLGGKRIRPAMVLASYEWFAPGSPENVKQLGVAVEMFHNFTLMHDDIMDNSPLRRGKATVHEKWDDSTAILSGDLMLIKVYELLGKIGHSQILEDFNDMAIELCEGQMMDMEFEEMRTVDNEDYMIMIRKKTAVLLAFALKAGATMAGASAEDQQRMYNIGIDLGLSFQLMDDYLDTFGQAAKVGKRIGGDILEKKKTFLWNSLMKELGDKEVEKIHTLRDDMDPDEYIDFVRTLMTSYSIDKACLALAKERHELALKMLAELPPSEQAFYLEEIFELLAARTH